MALNERLTSERLIRELADSKANNQFFRWSGAHTLLPALSLSQLSDLAELLDMPNGGHKSSSQAAAQSVHDTPLDSATDAPRVKSPTSHTQLPAMNASELDDLAELFGMSAHTTPSVPPAAAQSAEAFPVSL